MKKLSIWCAAAVAVLLAGCGEKTVFGSAAMKKLKRESYSEFLYRRGDICFSEDLERRGLDRYFRAAALGHAKSQYMISTFYLYGNHVDPCEAEAARWRAKAAPGLKLRAMQGDPEAQMLWSYCCKDDNGDRRLIRYWAEKSFENFRRQAEAGNAYACVMIGKFYENGVAGEKSPDKAAEWYRRAADQGYWDGIERMIHCHIYGIGVKKDIGQILIWNRKAAGNGSSSALASLGMFYEDGDLVEKDLRKAFGYYRAAAELGNPPAQLLLARCYENGIGTPPDRDKAIFWYRKASEDGLTDAKKRLAALTDFLKD